MNIRPTRIFPLGDNAVTVEFGNALSIELNAAAVSLANHFTANPFPGFVEAVPAIASTTVFFEIHEVYPNNTFDESSFTAVKRRIQNAIEKVPIEGHREGQLISIPVSFLPKDALDLNFVAKHSSLDANQVIDIFLSREYRVFMLGFLPGFPYMGVVDDRIAIPRCATPRTSVPKGSVGIAGRQTGIYPSESPGGWQIIGRTEVELFNPEKDLVCLLAPGDRVRFVRQ